MRICRVNPEQHVRKSNEMSEAIQIQGMEEHISFLTCMMSGGPEKCLRSLRRTMTVGTHRNDSGETGFSHMVFIESL
eukprot:13016882-Heterocapsa_arctica.AAC.1